LSSSSPPPPASLWAYAITIVVDIVSATRFVLFISVHAIPFFAFSLFKWIIIHLNSDYLNCTSMHA
jgi:hypothetical protein